MDKKTQKQVNQNAKLLSNLILNNLDAIYQTCKNSADEFGRENISLTFLKLVIEKGKPKLVQDERIDGLIREYCKTLDALFRVCDNRSKMIHKKNDTIALSSLKFYIEKIKKTYKLALRLHDEK
jgi:hypothetical protein